MEISFFDNVYSYKRINSCFTEAKKLITAKKGEGNFIVITESQSEGIGRRGKQWLSPEGGLWVTSALYNIPLKSCVTIFTALMIIKAIVKLFPSVEDYIGVKWPNDIVLDGKKLAGILTAFFPMHKYLLIGIGINTNNDELPEGVEATSLKAFLKDITPRRTKPLKIEHQELLNEIFDNFGSHLPSLIESDLANFLEDYHLYSILEGKTITLATEFQDYQGVVKGINKEGALLLQLKNGSIQPFLSGSIVNGYR